MESNEVIMTNGTSMSVASSVEGAQSTMPSVEVVSQHAESKNTSQVSDAQNADKLLDIAKTEGFTAAFLRLSEMDFEKSQEKVARYSFKNRQERELRENEDEVFENTNETTDVYGGGLAYGEEKLLDIRIQTLQETVDKLSKRNQELEEQLEDVGNEREYIASFYLQRAKALEEIALREKDEKKKGNWLSILVDVIANLMKMALVEDKDLEKQKEAETIEKLTS